MPYARHLLSPSSHLSPRKSSSLVAAGGPFFFFFFTLLSFLFFFFFFFRGKVFVVRCLVGPPNGLNIRNLLWHGFLDPEQLHPALLGIAAIMLL